MRNSFLYVYTCVHLFNRYRLPSLYSNGNPLQYSCLENPMDGGAWQAEVHGVTKSWTRVSDFTFPFHFHALEKEMAAHSSVLAWRIPGTGCVVGCLLWGLTESDTTEVTQQKQQLSLQLNKVQSLAMESSQFKIWKEMA